MHKALRLLIAFLLVSAIYLYAFPQANVFYAGVVLLHAAGGVIGAAWMMLWLIRYWRPSEPMLRAAMSLLLLGAIPGIVLIYMGALRAHWNLVYVHIGLSFLGVAFIAAAQWGNYGGLRGRSAIRVVAVIALLAIAAPVALYLRETRWNRHARIQNPTLPPLSMNGEGDGPNGPFFPSSAQVYGGEKIPSQFFMESDSCKRCHEDIYKQWNSSAHHFSSFNNQWYRKSIEYMQDTVGTKPSKWCGGCHDPAVLYAGKMDTPIKQIVHNPESQAGLGCMMCHSIAEVKSTMGQADFYLEYPKLHELAASKNPLVRTMHDFLIKLNPEPHRRVFLKPFMKQQTAEFCSSCHKVHLDSPVNHYRWIRGFNEYDNWQASGVSGEGARSFYYPTKPQQCADCHMPLERSTDMGSIAGKVHSHRFPGANTAVPTANEDAAQLKYTENFLTSGALTVDIFALSPASVPLKTKSERGGAAGQPELATTFAVGEESDTTARIPQEEITDVAPVTAPLDRVGASVRRGDTVRVDVVVRTKRVGHFFPGGTVDAYDTWLELKGVDDKGQIIFWSGMVEDNGKGPVEKGAHFYRSLQVDAHGNPINKRNAWSTRAVVYVRLIPPGAADTVHFRMKIPEKTGSKITLSARLCYRKFSWFNTQFAFAGEHEKELHGKRIENNAAQSENAGVTTPDFDDARMAFTASLRGVSAKEEKIPDLPIVAVAQNEVAIDVLPATASVPSPRLQFVREDWQRWNDYGIGLFLQGDLKGAQAAFEKVAQVDPQNPDGWVNIGRAALQEGDVARARRVLEKALALSPNLARAHFFYAGVLRQEGDYDGAVKHLAQVLAQYPHDRVALNNLGRIQFLQRKYSDAVRTLQQVLAVDPEDLQAHYNLMLCYNGLGDEKMSEEHKARYLRFKADESSQAITGPYRQLNPEDNNERQNIHEHKSVPLPVVNEVASSVGTGLSQAYPGTPRARAEHSSEAASVIPNSGARK